MVLPSEGPCQERQRETTSTPYLAHNDNITNTAVIQVLSNSTRLFRVVFQRRLRITRFKRTALSDDFYPLLRTTSGQTLTPEQKISLPQFHTIESLRAGRH